MYKFVMNDCSSKIFLYTYKEKKKKLKENISLSFKTHTRARALTHVLINYYNERS